MSVPGNLYTPTIRKTRGGDYLIEQSLLFDGSTTYLNRTPGTAGNRKTWTYSVWFKHVVDGSTANLFFGGVDLSNCTRIQFQNTGSINFRHLDAGVVTYQVATNGLYRDPSAWYHLVVAVDTTQATAADRVKIYINGIEQSYATTDYPAQNFDVDINSTAIHYIGRTLSTQEWDGLMALPILVDGAALDPTSFGEEDDDGYWNPIEYTTGSNVALSSEYGSESQYTTNASSYTFSSQAIGTAASNRVVYASFFVDSTGTTTPQLTSVTIGGVTATAVYIDQHSAGTTFHTEIWKATVPTGTTADVAVVAANTWDSINVGLHSVYGDQTLYSLAYTESNGGSMAVNVPDGATVINYAWTNTTTTNTWAGGSTSEDFDAQAYYTHSGAHEDVATGTGSTTYTATMASAGSRYAAVTYVLAPEEQAYGTNGFQLDFADTADFGLDVSEAFTAATRTIADNTINTSDTATYTFSSQNFGTAAADRQVVVLIATGTTATRTYSSVTIGGITATEIEVANGLSQQGAAFIANVPTGTSGDVVVTLSGTEERMQIFVYSLYGTEDGPNFIYSEVNTDPYSTTIYYPAGAILLGLGFGHSTGTKGFAWTNLTEDYDGVTEASSQGSSASDEKSTAGSLAITCTPASETNGGGMILLGFWPNGDASYQPVNFTAADQLSDTPTDSAADGIGNFCTWNPLFLDTTVSGTKSGSLSNGNLTFTGATSGYSYVIGTIGVTSGHWKMEFVLGDNDDRNIIGWTNNLNFDPSADDISVDGDNLFTSNVVGAEGVKINSTVIDTSATHANNGDTVGLSVDFDATTNNVKMYINNTEVASGDVDFSSYGSGPWYPATWDLSNGLSQVQTTNFGQSAFTTTNFPAAAKALATQNLPAPTIADGSDYFNTVLYEGTGSAQSITGVGFQPDLVWIKDRDIASAQNFVDSVRGPTKYLQSHSTNLEGTDSQRVSSFDSDGFTVGTNGNTNTNTDDIVAWCWKAGTTFNGTSNRSKAYVTNYNATSGFSIITYTGSSSSGYQTLNHKLGVAPKMVIIKNRGRGVTNWPVYHTSCDIAANKAVFLNTTAAQAVDSTLFNATFESTNIYVNSSNDTNLESDTYVAYCWAEVEGFSKFGSYAANGSADGPFIYTGFLPAWIMIKGTSHVSNWNIIDISRATYNPADRVLRANLADSEFDGTSSSIEIDFLSNGFKIRGGSGANDINQTSESYIYSAFAAQPFQGDDGYTQARAR